MEYRKIQGTDLEVSRLVLGTMTFGSQVDESEAADMVSRARDAGINLFDTANGYSKGESERMLGAAVKSFRDDVLIATKVRAKMGDGPDEEGLSEAAINKAIDASLNRLQTDYVDIYYLHRPDPEVPIEESLGAMNAVVESGKARYIAVSNYAAWHITHMLYTCERNGWAAPVASQVLYNVMSRRLDEEYAACAAKFGFHTFVFNPLAGGLLTGKYREKKDGIWTKGGVFDERQMYRDRYWGSQQFEALKELERVATDEGLTLLELAYRWLLSREFVGSIIMGASRIDQLEENLEAADGPLPSTEALERCDAIWREWLRGPAPNYNREDDEGGKLP